MRVIVSPQESLFVAVMPGRRGALNLPDDAYAELLGLKAEPDAVVPEWFADAAGQAWQIELAGMALRDAVVVRPPSFAPATYSRASYEINLGCNFSCERCYLEQRPFAAMPLASKHRLIDMLADLGVLWFQITGGEPLIDPDFIPAYEQAHDAGMMVEILTNGSRLGRPDILATLAARRPHKVTVSMYGASAATADALTNTRGAFKNMYSGLIAAAEAGLPVEVTIIVTKHNVDDLDAMRSLIGELGLPSKEYGSISPNYTGNGKTLNAQAPGYLDKSAVFAGCPAGHTSFHVDPHGMATMCKVGLSQLVRGAAILAIEDGTEQITRDLLDLVPVDFAAEKAARPTPSRQRKRRNAKTAAATA